MSRRFGTSSALGTCVTHLGFPFHCDRHMVQDGLLSSYYMFQVWLRISYLQDLPSVVHNHKDVSCEKNISLAKAVVLHFGSFQREEEHPAAPRHAEVSTAAGHATRRGRWKCGPW